MLRCGRCERDVADDHVCDGSAARPTAPQRPIAKNAVANAFSAALAEQLIDRTPPSEEVHPTTPVPPIDVGSAPLFHIATPDHEPDEFVRGSRIGDYRVTGKLGAGGMGAVYAALHVVIDKPVAIKVIGRDLFADLSFRQIALRRFVQEARAVNRVRSAHIIDIFGFGSLPDGRPFFVMELLDGVSLGRRLRRSPTLTLDELLSVLVQVTDALRAAHAASVIHRDLKPDNIQIWSEAPSPQVKLLDFGIAKLATNDLSSASTAGQPLGTPLFMSPEQCRGEAATARSDLYSLGVIMFYALTGRLPFRATSLYEVYTAHISLPPSPPSRINPEVPPALDALVLRCLAKRAEDRPASAAELAEALRQLLTSLSDDVRERRLPVTDPSLAPTSPDRRARADAFAKVVAPSEPHAGPARRRAPIVAVACVLIALAAGVTARMTRAQHPVASVAQPAIERRVLPAPTAVAPAPVAAMPQQAIAPPRVRHHAQAQPPHGTPPPTQAWSDDSALPPSP